MRTRLAAPAALVVAAVVSFVGCTMQATPERTAASPGATAGVYQRAAVITSPAEARRLLEEGNARFVSGAVLGKDLSQARRDELAKGQKPFAVVVTCSDSRVPPEVLFDQALGDVFVVRVAGNVVDAVALGSVEYAVEHLGSPLVVVMGHTRCGAVKATVDGGEAPGAIGSIVERVKPAVARAKADGATAAELAERSADVNVELQRKAIERSKLVGERIQAGQLQVIGAKYDITSGEVHWF